MNIRYAASFLGILKIAQGNECIQDEYIQISNAIKLACRYLLSIRIKARITDSIGESNCFMKCVWSLEI